MKLLAIIIPVALFMMPTIAFVAYVAILGAQGKNPGKVKYPFKLMSRRVQIFMWIATSVYFAAFVASIFWSIYILTGWYLLSIFTDTVLLFPFFLTLFLAVCIIIPMVISHSRLLKQMPPPANGFLNESEYWLWKNKIMEAYGKYIIKSMPKYALLLLAVCVLIIALTILFSLYNRAK